MLLDDFTELEEFFAELLDSLSSSSLDEELLLGLLELLDSLAALEEELFPLLDDFIFAEELLSTFLLELVATLSSSNFRMML